jgi:hypothetical protein
MKLQTVKSAIPSVRCVHRDSSARQCRLLASGAHSSLRPQHQAQQKQKVSADFSDILFRDSQDFQTAQGINYSLRHLYWLTAQNRISSRRAAVLALHRQLAPPHPAPNRRRQCRRHQIPAQKIGPPLSPTPPKPLNVPVPESEPAKTWGTSIPEPDPNKKPS